MPTKKSGKGSGKKSNVDIQAEAKAAYYAYLSACKSRKCYPSEHVSAAFSRIMTDSGESKEGNKSKKKKRASKGAEVLVLVGEDVKAKNAKALSDVLIEYPRVKNLCFWGTKAGDGALDAICSILNHKAINRWSKASSLSHIEILGSHSRQYTDVPTDTERGGKDVHKCEQTFSLSKLDNLSSSLLHTTTLIQVLVLDGNTLGDSGFSKIFRGLCGLRTLKKLGMSYTGLTDASGPLLETLISGHLPTINEYGDSRDGIALTANGRSRMRQEQNIPASKGAASIHTDLFPLKENIDSNIPTFITASDPLMIAEPKSMTLISSVEILSLEGNYLGMSSLQHIGIGLQSADTKLRILNLTANDICPNLSSNTSSETSADQVALSQFFAGLASSTTLTSVDLRRNEINASALQILIPAVAANTNIKVFRVPARIPTSLSQSLVSIISSRNTKGKSKKKGGRKRVRRKSVQ